MYPYYLKIHITILVSKPAYIPAIISSNIIPNPPFSDSAFFIGGNNLRISKKRNKMKVSAKKSKFFFQYIPEINKRAVQIPATSSITMKDGSLLVAVCSTFVDTTMPILKVTKTSKIWKVKDFRGIMIHRIRAAKFAQVPDAGCRYPI
jgi:hypothetical protein